MTPRQARLRLIRDMIGLIFIAGAMMYAVTLVVANERSQAIETEKRRAFEHLSSMRTAIEQRIQANVLVMRALKPEVLWQDTPDRDRLQNMIDEFLSSDLDISHLALAPDLRISFIYPLEGNEQLIGVDYRNVEAQYHEILRAIASQNVLLSRPIDLLQGGRALIARVPIFQTGGAFWGIASLVINHEHLFKAVEFYDHPEYRFLLQRQELNAEIKAIAGDVSVMENDPMTTQLKVPGDIWQLSVAPRYGDWLPSDYDVKRIWLIGSGLCAMIVFAFAILIFTQHRLRHAVHTISFQARFDPLTELANRNYFQQQLESKIFGAHKQAQNFALVMLDLDHLRDINDALGHDIGDRLLQHVAKRIHKELGPGDLLARVGGDEFALVLDNVSGPHEAERNAKALVNTLTNTADIQQNPINITASVGIAMFPADAVESQQLIKCAELAMYAAKSTGSLTVSFFDEQLRRSTEQHIALHHDMINALDEAQFHVEYQPVIETATGLIKRCEALIRWHHPERGEISPSEFIPIAEKTGSIIALGEFVMAQILKDWQVMRDAGFDFTVAINRSPREFNDKDVAMNWLAALDASGMPADKLMIEITESMLMRNQERQLFNLRRLRSAGVHLAIDDFGTGYSSLNYLRSYPIDVIKIDRGFLRDVPHNRQQTALVEALLRIAHTLDMDIIAEGVETAAQANFLQDKGCHFQQGFYYGHSMRLETFIAFCQQHNRRVSS